MTAFLQRAAPISGVALPPAPDPPAPVPDVRNAIDKARTMAVVNAATDDFGKRLAGLMPAVIDRINTYLRFKEGIWDDAQEQGLIDDRLGPDWAGLYVKVFTLDPTMSSTMSVDYTAWRMVESRDSLGGGTDYFVGLVIREFKYNNSESITSLTDAQLSGILLHELAHPLISYTMVENNTQEDGAYTTNTAFPTAYPAYYTALGLTDEEAGGRIMTRQFKCNSTTADPDDGTSYQHWENVTRDVDGTTYKGIINDCLRTCYATSEDSPNSPGNWILTDLTINAAADNGLERVKTGNEGAIQVQGEGFFYGSEVTYNLPSYGEIAN